MNSSALAANTLDHSGAGGGGRKTKQNSHSGKRHKKEEEIFIPLSVVGADDRNGAHISDFQINLEMSRLWHSLPDCYQVTLELAACQRVKPGTKQRTHG